MRGQWTTSSPLCQDVGALAVIVFPLWHHLGDIRFGYAFELERGFCWQKTEESVTNGSLFVLDGVEG